MKCTSSSFHLTAVNQLLYQYTDADIYGYPYPKIYRVNDWAPILNTIKINKSLEFIAVRSYYTPPSEENGQFSFHVFFIRPSLKKS